MIDNRGFYNIIGSNIRMFRKAQQIKQSELAKVVNKSVPCISKYEDGNINMDIYTLYEIADALHISPQQLLPDTGLLELRDNRSDKMDLYNEKLPLLMKSDPLFFYWFNSGKAIMNCALKITSDLEAFMYLEFQDNDYKKCKYILSGSAYVSDVNTIVFCRNEFLNGDYVFLSFRNSDMLNTTSTTGACSCLSGNYRSRLLQCYASNIPITNREFIFEKLEVTKEEVQSIKKNGSVEI